MFENAQIGDRVWDIRYGWGIIQYVGRSSQYPISVVFDFKYTNNRELTECYTYTGCFSTISERPTLFWNEFEIPPEAFIKPQPKLAKNTKVLVWNDSPEIKEKRYFSHFNKGRIYCYEQGCTSWSGTTAHDWDNWELYKEE
jgi:hypothetical protein